MSIVGRYLAVSLPRRVVASLVAVPESTAAMALGSLVLFGAKVALSVAVGGLVAAANLWALARIVVSLLPEESENSTRSTRLTWSFVAAAKLAALLAILFFLMSSRFLSPIALVCGFGALPIGIAIGSFVRDRSDAKNG
jgi:hypothetical protein